MQYLFFTIKLYLILEQEKKCVSYIGITYFISSPPLFFLEKEGEKRKNRNSCLRTDRVCAVKFTKQ